MALTRLDPPLPDWHGLDLAYHKLENCGEVVLPMMEPNRAETRRDETRPTHPRGDAPRHEKAVGRFTLPMMEPCRASPGPASPERVMPYQTTN